MKITFTISGTNYSIDADGNQYVLIRHGVTQKGDKKGSPTETALGYFSQIKNALNTAVKSEFGSQPDEITLKEFLERYESAMASIHEQIGEV